MKEYKVTFTVVGKKLEQKKIGFESIEITEKKIDAEQHKEDIGNILLEGKTIAYDFGNSCHTEVNEINSILVYALNASGRYEMMERCREEKPATTMPLGEVIDALKDLDNVCSGEKEPACSCTGGVHRKGICELSHDKELTSRLERINEIVGKIENRKGVFSPIESYFYKYH